MTRKSNSQAWAAYVDGFALSQEGSPANPACSHASGYASRLPSTTTEIQRADGTPAALTLLVRCLARRAAAECMRRNTTSPTSNQEDHNG